MGVLIKDMKMPKGFEMLVVFSDGTAHKCLPGMREHVEKGTAVHVPPHGRLIDADALYKEALKRSETKDGYYNCLDPVISCYTIDHAPTIIPAEEHGVHVDPDAEGHGQAEEGRKAGRSH